MFNQDVPLNKVFVSERGFFRQIKTEKVYAIVRDISSIEFIIEELISNAAYEIVFDSWGKEKDDSLLANLAVPLRKHIKFIDDQVYTNIANEIMSPVFEEYHIQSDSESLSTATGHGNDEIHMSIAICCFTLREFILGAGHQLQIDIDIKSFRKAVSAVRLNSRNPVSRYNMSVIEGILKCYKPIKIDSLAMVPDATKNHTNMLIDFLEDNRYLVLSQAHNKLGIPSLLAKSLKDIRQATRHILSNDKFKMIFDGSTKLITAGTKIPLPSTELISSILNLGYLPVIVDIKPLMGKAHKAWTHLRGPDNAPDGIFKDFGRYKF